MNKIVFFDLDGTLLDTNKLIRPSTRRAVRLLQQKGIHTAVATGRVPGRFDWVLKELNISSFVSNNGQYVVHDGKEIYANPMDADLLHDMTEAASRRGHALAYCGDGDVTVGQEDHPMIISSFAEMLMAYPVVTADYHRTNNVYQANLFCPAGEEAYYAERYPGCRFIRFNHFGCDVLPAGASKAIGIQQLLHVAGIPNESCYAFGDGPNDVEMLASVGVGIAMGNAVAETKAAASIVTASNEEDGIWHGLIAAGLLEPEAVAAKL